MVACPHCNSKQIIKKGIREDKLGQVGQKYHCKDCEK